MSEEGKFKKRFKAQFADFEDVKSIEFLLQPFLEVLDEFRKDLVFPDEYSGEYRPLQGDFVTFRREKIEEFKAKLLKWFGDKK